MAEHDHKMMLYVESAPTSGDDKPSPQPPILGAGDGTTFYQRQLGSGRLPLNNRLSFEIATDPMQQDKATEIRLFSAQRPHMRAFHFAWLSFFIAFFGWFSIPPLMPTIKKQLHLTDDQVATSNIVALSSAIVGRIIVGPLCDRYGARSVQTVLLIAGAVPVASAALVNDYTGLLIARWFIGLIGCAFVTAAYWTSIMFSNEVVGSANAIAAGWGNCGAGVSYLVTPLVFDLLTMHDTISTNVGWRLALVFPGIIMVIVGICTYFFSDDCPQGNYAEMKKNHTMASKPRADLIRGFFAVAKLPVTWILAFQYACSLGVELQVQNVLSLYFYEDFSKEDCDPETDKDGCRLLSQTSASAVSACFGLMCIFARAIGGYASDVANRYHDMKGRLYVQLALMSGEAVVLFLFSQVRTLQLAIPCLLAFGFFVHASCGSTYGIVPYVAPRYTGVMSGIVGAGGNMGGLAWGFLFKLVGSNDALSFEYMSFVVAVAAVCTAAIQIEGQRTLLNRHNAVHSNGAGDGARTGEPWM